MAAAVVDIPYLAASFNVSEPSLTSLLESPTVELVASLLNQIQSKAREYDALRAEKLRSEVELENAIRSGETRAKSLKASVEKTLKDVEELRTQLNDERTCWVSCRLVSDGARS